MCCTIDCRGLAPQPCYFLGEDFSAVNPQGDRLGFTNCAMMVEGRPFFGISGELHYSRLAPERWEEALLKMKQGGINTVSTYALWIHHEEQEGVFRFDGRYDLRRFVQLCQRCGLYVILRAGPFNHGEVRNGGLPDWLYAKPFEVRSLDAGFLSHVRRLYRQYGEQTQGLYWEDGGPIIGVQLDNEYMASSAPWEMTAQTSGKWVAGGSEGEAYILRLRELAAECGLRPAFYTCTAWGGAPVPENVLPLWGGYAYQPWLFYFPPTPKRHPATGGYIYQDFHHSPVSASDDFRPGYAPESRPYACCEMGGGMTCGYRYRFQFPGESVDAMANIRLGSGCNFLGYYMFHGGSNPQGRHGAYLNEGQLPKISYDYQAALGEFGQLRRSYRRLRSLHLFLAQLGEGLCGMQTVLPAGASAICPEDGEALRCAVRTGGVGGYLFINNFQDHFSLPARKGAKVIVKLPGQQLRFCFDLAGGENAILPFFLELDGIVLRQACAQPVTRLEREGEVTWVFLIPEGMRGSFQFEEEVRINGEETSACRCAGHGGAERFTIQKGERRVQVLAVSRALSEQMAVLSGGRLVFTEAAVFEDGQGIRLQSEEPVCLLRAYPADALQGLSQLTHTGDDGMFGLYQAEAPRCELAVSVKQAGPSRYALSLPQALPSGLADARLQLCYTGDTGSAFLGGRLVHDHFYNGDVWEFSLRELGGALENEPLVVYIAPFSKGSPVKIEPVPGRPDPKRQPAALHSARIQPVYAWQLA